MRGLMTLIIGLLLLKLLWDYGRWRRLQRLQRQRAQLAQRHGQELFQLEADLLNRVIGEADYQRRLQQLKRRHDSERQQLGL